MRAAVIGGTGFIGSHLVEALVRGGAGVLAVARGLRRIANLDAVRGDCDFQAADILDADSIRAVLRDFRPDVVFHMASGADGPESLAHITESIESNAVGTANVLDAACRAGAGVLVYADSCKVYGNGPVPYRAEQPEAPVCSYAIGKAAGWRLCKLASAASGIAVCGLRSTLVYGPRQNPNVITHVRDCVRRGTPVRLMGAGQTRDLLFVEDAVRAFLRAATEPAAWGSAIPIGGGRELSVTEICRGIVRIMGGSIEVVPGAQKPRMTEIWRSFCDNRDARNLLGWAPAVSHEEGLSRTLLEAPPPPPQRGLAPGARP